MNALRISKALPRLGCRSIRPLLQRRTYADAVEGRLKLNLTLPHQAIYKSANVVQVNLVAESGHMGVLPQHVPAIEQLQPGVMEVIEAGGAKKKFFLSGGFAIIQPGSELDVNAVEGYPLEEFSIEAVHSQIAEAQKVAAGSGSEQDIAEAKVELKVLERLQSALK